MIDADQVFDAAKQKLIEDMTQEELAEARIKMAEYARNFLITNQEAYVCQWVLQNPFLNVGDFKLVFEYTDKGYTCQMERVKNVQ